MRPSMDKTVEDVMTSALVTAEVADTIGVVRHLMLHNRVHCIPVLDQEGHPLGMVTSWDLVDSLPPDTKVSRVMTEDVISIGPEASLVAAAEKMMVNYVHHLAVADDQLKVLGIISSFDLLGEIISSQDQDFQQSQPA